jgi:glycosyltransferase involved in cell wall biosynthesis
VTKLIIQIPCFNEEQSLPATIAELPRELPGIDCIEWLIINDGSSDRTVEVARSLGVDHVVDLPSHQGLARGFVAGLEACIDAGADIIVNTDADNQYRADDIPLLIAPILAGTAEMVVGERPIEETEHFSPLKKGLQRFGSWVTRMLSGTEVVDAVSGFRAFSRDAAMRLHVFSDYTYTVETIIQAGQKGIAVKSVPVRTNDPLRQSRLVVSMSSYLQRQMSTMIRIFMTYRPFRFFAIPGLAMLGVGLLLGFRFLWYYWTEGGAGHVQSLILTALLVGGGALLVLIGFAADLVSVNRKLLEGIDWRMRKIEEELRKSRD